MGLNPLGQRWRRRLTRIVGTTVVHASAAGYGINFTTIDHRHGWFDMKAWKYPDDRPMWGLYDPGEAECFTSCLHLFGDRSPDV